MAFPTTSVISDFNIADENPLSDGGKWSGPINTGGDRIKVFSNQATEATGNYHSAYTTTSYGPDSEAYMTIETIDSDYMDVMVRVESAGTSPDGYSLQLASFIAANRFVISRFDGGSETQLGATITQTFSAGDSMGMEMIGSTISAYRKTGGTWGSAFATRTDSTHTGAGKLAIRFGTFNSVVDDFGGGTISTGVTVNPNPSILTFSVPQPTLTYGGVTVSPNVAVLTFTAPQPTIVYGTVVNTPDTAVFTLNVPQPVIVPGVYTLAVDPAVLTFAVPNPSVSGGANIITPDSVVLTLTTPEPTVVPGTVTITPSPAVMDFSVPEPSLVVGEATVTPDSVVLEFLVPEPVIVVTGTNNPDPVVLDFAVPNPTITLGTVIVAPDSVVLTFTIPNPSVTDGSATSTGQFIFLRRRRRQQHG